MQILGYIVQYFDEEKIMPETGYKYLYKTHSDALSFAKTRMTEYITSIPADAVGPFEAHSPTKKQTDDNGFSIVFRNGEVQIWIEAIVS